MPYSMKFAKKKQRLLKFFQKYSFNKSNIKFEKWNEICKEWEDSYKISKNEGYFFGQHPMVEKSPTATDIYIFTLGM